MPAGVDKQDKHQEEGQIPVSTHSNGRPWRPQGAFNSDQQKFMGWLDKWDIWTN